MEADRAAERARSPVFGNRRRPSALPGKGGLTRILDSAANSFRGMKEGLRTEAAIQQEFAIAAVFVPLSFVLATSVWVWVALVASLLFVLVVEFLNTAVERLCNHVTPELHDAIRVTKDLASSAVFFALSLAGLVWGAAALLRLGLIG
ncbi:diacylglycerol kinase [Faunimonas sp. B44]|uniref:diacylglycerol kinase n=1 Tax=Faunimonas sp. B44 TaxID=3461493 RepID=UPI004044FE19